MSIVSEKAADLAAMIAEDPVTVKAYRRSPGNLYETLLGTFTARVDDTAVRVSMDSISAVGTFAKQGYVLIWPSTGLELRHNDEVRASWSDGRANAFRVLSARDYGWKREAMLEELK